MLDDALVLMESTTLKEIAGQVSILIVLDDALVPELISNKSEWSMGVSILIVLDDALVHTSKTHRAFEAWSQSLLCWTML